MQNEIKQVIYFALCQFTLFGMQSIIIGVNIVLAYFCDVNFSQETSFFYCPIILTNSSTLFHTAAHSFSMSSGRNFCRLCLKASNGQKSAPLHPGTSEVNVRYPSSV